jgi:hypothetical protein
MSVRLLWCFAVLIATTEVALGQSVAYEPLGTWVDPQTGALARWNARVLQASVRPGVSPTSDTRPQFAGRPKSVELLENYFLQKHPKLLQSSPERARQLILRRYSNRPGPLRGYMAEAMFMDRNPEWNLVRGNNAPQHDVTRRIPGRRAPFNGQIKYHDSGTSALYARDMVKERISSSSPMTMSNQ